MGGPPGYHQPYNQGHFPQQPPYGGGQPPPQQYPPNNGYMGWHNGQQPPPTTTYGGPGWPPGQGPPHGMGMYRQGGPHPGGIGGHDRAFGGYRGPPNPSTSRRAPPQADQSPPRKSNKGEGPPPGYWGQQQQQWQQQHQWGPGSGGPPSMWQGGPSPIQQQPGSSPPPNMPQHMQGLPKMWPGSRNGMTSPTRPPRRSPETMPNGMMGPNGYRGPINGIDFCNPVGVDGDPGVDMYVRDDKSKLSQADRDKGRGSYRCGRCGAPKKGHVCPYQPKLKRRPDEPPPEMRNAAIQVEMDEFMTLRRLNIEIQGFSESYATAPHIGENMVVGEPHPLALQVGVQQIGENGEAVTPKVSSSSSPPQDSPEVLRSSPITASPIVES